MRVCLAVLLALGLFALAVPGCGPGVAEEELGTIVFDAEQLPGKGERFELPDVSQPSAPQPKTEPADES